MTLRRSSQSNMQAKNGVRRFVTYLGGRKLRMLTCDHPVPPDRYNDRVEEHLRVTGFYHASQIGVVQNQKALVNALIERWHPDTHTFHLPIGECAVSLEDVALILGLPTDGLPVTGMTMSSFPALEAECLHQFGVAPSKSECRGCCIKLTWLRDLKENIQLTDEISIQRYVKCHIMLLIGTILFGDKSGAGVHWKFLPLLRDFASIGQYSWGSACLAHLYRVLCRASRYNCKEMGGPITLLLSWAWMRMPYLSPVPREPHSFPLANSFANCKYDIRWRNWERGDRRYRYLNLAHFRKAFDDLQEGQFVWVAYAVDRVDPNIIPAEIYMQSVVWTATVPLVSFECVEWHATDRFRRQFGFLQGVPSEERSLDKAHGEVLTGPKNLNWATTPTHSSWVMHWTNRYNYILSELPINSPHPLETYMQWYRSKYGNRLNLSNLVGQDSDEDNQDIDEGNEVMDEDNEGMDDDNEELDPQLPQTSISNPQTQEQPQFSSQYVPQTQFYPSFPMHQQYWGMSQFDPGEGGSFSQLLGFMAGDAGQSQYGNEAEILAGRYSLDARLPCHTSSVASGGFVSVDFSRSEGGRGVLNSQNPNRVSMGPVQEDANTPEDDTNAYIVDEMEEDVDDDEDEIEEFDEDEDEESRNDGQAHTPDDKGKGYNLRIDPPRRSANRYTPSVFKKAAKKCKNFVNDVKTTVFIVMWTMILWMNNANYDIKSMYYAKYGINNVYRDIISMNNAKYGMNNVYCGPDKRNNATYIISSKQ
nr:serine/threonine-protein phosphatase 7 long form homolog [Arachis hypogaea]